MGIKYLHSYLENHPSLKHSINNPKPSTANIIVWDCLGWLRKLYRCHARTAKLLFDFKQMDDECRQIIRTFKQFGFELIAFIDGYHCGDKVAEKSRRKRSTLKNIQKNLKLIKQMHAAKSKNAQNKLLKKIEFVPSNGYAHYLEQSLTRNGCAVYRGTSQIDIDKDIVRFVMNQKGKIYGIMSTDSDFFGFYDLPSHIKLISDYRTKRSNKQNMQTLNLTFYKSVEFWQQLKLRTNDQRLQLIALCGNDFVKKRTKECLFRRCGMNENQINKCTENVLEIVAKSILSKQIYPCSDVFECVKAFYSMSNHQNIRFEANVNVNWRDLKQCNVFHGGFFFHDIEADKFTIHQKLANIRHVLAKKYLKLESMTEWIPKYEETKSDERVNVYKEYNINLQQMKFKSEWNAICLFSRRGTYDDADLYSVFEGTLKFLVNKGWIDNIQHIALKLQFEIKHSLKRKYGNWPFFNEYAEFRRSGVPRIKDLTAQWLYIELSRLLCWNPQNIHPCLHYLFDGVLYHLFCKIQADGDKNGIIYEMHEALIEIKEEYRGNNNRYGRKRNRFNEENGRWNSQPNYKKQKFHHPRGGRDEWYRY